MEKGRLDLKRVMEQLRERKRSDVEGTGEEPVSRLFEDVGARLSDRRIRELLREAAED